MAVKEFLPRTVLSDVRHEARILMQLRHPLVPYLFGIGSAISLTVQWHPLPFVIGYNCSIVQGCGMLIVNLQLLIAVKSMIIHRTTLL